MLRRNLVAVRAGDNSLHPHWLKGESSRNWDIVVSYFGDDPDLYKTDDLTRIDGKSQKWQGLHALFTNHPEFLKGYDYILLPDDDLMMSKEDINRLFDLPLILWTPDQAAWRSACSGVIYPRAECSR
jgi:hypothetical protein